jgi:membrane-bound lytic murein transglycosylase B
MIDDCIRDRGAKAVRQTFAIIASAAMLAAAPAVAQDAPQDTAERMETATESWLPSLLTETPEEGFELAVLMARKAVMTTPTDTEILHALRPNYGRDPQSLIDVSGVVATYFATVAAASDYWRD